MRIVPLSECIAVNRLAMRGAGNGIPSLGIYVGSGSSHSWIWLVDALERLGFLDLRFLREGDIRADTDCHVLFVSGGDTFTLAESIGPSRLGALEKWIAGGGKYVGICAGAYLPLHSSIPPLSSFNLVRGRISNLAKDLPRATAMEEKFSTRYGCSYVFNPVRGPLLIDCLGTRMIAPLYGGPAWDGAVEAEVLGRYISFTPQTLFLSDESLAKETIIGRPAALRKKYGEGTLYLFGPHFEHPDNPESAGIIAGAVHDPEIRPLWRGEEASSNSDYRGQEASTELRSMMSEARILYRGLEGARWHVGGKIWDHERIGYFINAIWERLRRPREDDVHLVIPEGTEEGFAQCLDLMRSIRIVMKEGRDATGEADLLVRTMVDSSARFFEGHFRSLRAARE